MMAESVQKEYIATFYVCTIKEKVTLKNETYERKSV